MGPPRFRCATLMLLLLYAFSVKNIRRLGLPICS
ncbi:unnamed protein product [Linum tenue]|uniref:Uncharacterized protein n=1 Tax=Linum tenue TaxID=586396 RepID=A0AAV0NIP6_9ROSI|nr:unnamed protein product [Linum tenue]